MSMRYRPLAPVRDLFRVALIVACIAFGGPVIVTRECGAAEPPSPQSHSAYSLAGVWKPADMAVSIRISGAGGQFTGTVVESANPAMLNQAMLRGISFDPSRGEGYGEVFAPKRGVFVPMSIRMTADDRFRMTAGSGLLSKTIDWTRTQ